MILKLRNRVRRGTRRCYDALEMDVGFNVPEHKTIAHTSSKERIGITRLGLLRTAEDTRDLIAQYLDGWNKTVADKVRELEFTFEDVK